MRASSTSKKGDPGQSNLFSLLGQLGSARVVTINYLMLLDTLLLRALIEIEKPIYTSVHELDKQGNGLRKSGPRRHEPDNEENSLRKASPRRQLKKTQSAWRSPNDHNWRSFSARYQLWLNLGDTYGKTSAKLARRAGVKPGELIGVPWRVALALQADGWNFRADLIWHKPNPKPESVKNRPTKAHEYLFLFSKKDTYCRFQLATFV